MQLLFKMAAAVLAEISRENNVETKTLLYNYF